MAIFIVDQFSLNTDLPLDIRYVPDGGSYFDVSAYWYPGMQVYQTDDQKIWYADNSLNWHPISEGIDASVSALYQIVSDLSTYIDNQFSIINSSIGTIESSIGNIYVRLQVLDSSVATLDSSVKDLYSWQISQDASIVILRDTNVSQDASIVLLTSWQISQDASIDALRSKDASIDASLNLLGIWNSNQDTSITQLDSLISAIDTCLGNFVNKAGDTMTGSLVITGGGLKVGSIGTPLDVSIYSDLYVHNNAVIGGNLWVDGSVYITNRETIDVSAGFIHINTGLTGIPPASMQSGIVVGRGSLEPYVFIFDETNQSFRIGIATETSTGYLDSSTQAVATRGDTPIINGIAVWNASLNRFDTFSDLTFNGSVFKLDTSMNLSSYAGGTDLMLVVAPDGTVKSVPTFDGSINDLYTYVDGSLALRDASINNLNTRLISAESSIGTLDSSVVELFNRVGIIDASITYIDSSINQLFAKDSSSIKGGVNIGDGSAGVFAGIDSSMNLQFKEIKGIGSVVVTEDSSTITLSFDASASSDVTSASNIPGGDASIFLQKTNKDLEFRSFVSLDPSNLTITNDASFVYFDVSISGAFATLADVSLGLPLITHQIPEYDASASKWVNTSNIFWDISLGTTTDDLGGIHRGTDLNGLTLKEILYKILYEYQPPTLLVGTDTLYGTYEKGLVSTQFSTIDVSYYSTTANYPLALLNNVHITKTEAGSIFDASLGLVATAAGTYTDLTGITNWGGTNRTISYNVTIDDDQADQSQPAVGLSRSFTFYYRQYWGMVNGNTNANQVDSDMIKGLINSRLAGESDLVATFDNSTGGFVKYLFAYPDTVASPDNFGTLSQIIDQNEFDITGSWNTENEDVSVGVNNIRYRFYLLKNKVDTSIFEVTFKF